ncbi:MAG: helix-turn-helix domain-containing protein [Aureliella sp.]
MKDRPAPVEQAAYTVQELAKRWRVSTNTVGRMIHAGQLRAFQVGLLNSCKPRFRIPYSEVERHEAGDGPGGLNEDKIAAMQTPTAKIRAARNPSRRLPKVKEFIK